MGQRLQGLPAAGAENRVVPPDEVLHDKVISRMTRPSKLDHLIIHFNRAYRARERFGGGQKLYAVTLRHYGEDAATL